MLVSHDWHFIIGLRLLLLSLVFAIDDGGATTAPVTLASATKRLIEGATESLRTKPITSIDSLE